jgi:hypothetical protein
LHDCDDQKIGRVANQEVNAKCKKQIGRQVHHRDPIHLLDSLKEPLWEHHRSHHDSEARKEYGPVIVEPWDKENKAA